MRIFSKNDMNNRHPGVRARNMGPFKLMFPWIFHGFFPIFLYLKRKDFPWILDFPIPTLWFHQTWLENPEVNGGFHRRLAYK